jgi:hypothetical protein
VRDHPDWGKTSCPNPSINNPSIQFFPAWASDFPSSRLISGRSIIFDPMLILLDRSWQ